MSNTAAAPTCLPGFEHVYHYRDRREEEWVAKLKPGDYYVTRVEERLETVLGSCIAACVRDPGIGVGGMNHFLLPATEASPTSADLVHARYGNFAMEALINEILKQGGSRRRLEIKLFGGARMIAGLSDVGLQNIRFVEAYLRAEGMSIDSKDVGGIDARLVRYWPNTGRVRLKRLCSDDRLARNEELYRDSISTKPAGGSIELF